MQCDGDSANHNTGQNRFFLWWLVELFAEGRNFDQTGSPADCCTKVRLSAKYKFLA